MSESSFAILYNKTLRFLSFRPRSEKEVADYLKKKKASKKDLKAILDKLREYDFVNDLDFAKWWIENRKKGQRLIFLELGQKGISKEITEEASSQFDLVKKQAVLLEKLIEKKWKILSKDPKGYHKMIGFLMRRGFDYSVSKDAIKKHIGIKFDD